MVDDECQLIVSLSVDLDFKSLEVIGVYIENVPRNKVVVGICGDTNELGEWNPERGTLCKLVKTAPNGVETWHCRFTCAVRREFQYRYFVAELNENNDECTDSNLFRILAWESRLKARNFSLFEYLNSSDKKSVTNVKFGVYDNGHFVQRGWLTSNSELHVRLTGSACKFFNWSASAGSTNLRLYISCFKYVVQPSFNEDYNTDTITYETPEIRFSRSCENLMNPSAESKLQSTPPSPNGSLSATPYGKTEPVLLSTLEMNRCRVHPGENNECRGTIYKPGDDVIFYVETSDIENTAVLVEFHKALPNSSNLLFVGSARFGPFEGTCGRKASQILNSQQIPVGDLRIQYLIIHPMSRAPPPSLAITYQHHWKKRRPFEIGHRGMGTSFIEKSERSTKKPATTKENTLDSFREAVNHGADFVEMDVQLTKDHHVIVYHDYEAVIISRKKRGGQLSYLPIAIKDLNYEDLRELKVHHSSVLHEGHTHEKMNEDDLDPIELQSFPLLRSCLEEIDPELGFVIEVKYPMDLKAGKSEMPNFFEYNFYVDKILREILTHAGKRRILLSCFDPNVCAMLQLKQNIYPVFQLGIDPEYNDSRQSGFERLFWSAISQQLLGVCLESDRLLEQPDLLKLAHEHGLIVLAWGEAVNSQEKRAQLSSLGVDGMIYDRLYEHKEKGTLNVFKQKAFISGPPVCTTAPSQDEQQLKPSANTGDVLQPTTMAAENMAPKCCAAAPSRTVYGPAHVAIVKECVELEKLSHTNSTTTCESMPVNTTELNNPSEHVFATAQPEAVPESGQNDSGSAEDSSTQHAVPLITMA